MASKQVVEDVKKAAEVIAKTATTSPSKAQGQGKGGGPKPKHGASRKTIAEAIGSSETSVRAAEQHVETAAEYPFMQHEDWRESREDALRAAAGSVTYLSTFATRRAPRGAFRFRTSATASEV